jgi:hypothetical protein
MKEMSSRIIFAVRHTSQTYIPFTFALIDYSANITTLTKFHYYEYGGRLFIHNSIIVPDYERMPHFS